MSAPRPGYADAEQTRTSCSRITHATKVFASFFKKKRFLLFLFEKKNQKTFVH
jgi:hypothetical protein